VRPTNCAEDADVAAIRNPERAPHADGSLTLEYGLIIAGYITLLIISILMIASASSKRHGRRCEQGSQPFSITVWDLCGRLLIWISELNAYAAASR
jgi:hypothetical protein